jgi:hypothetical protein
MIQSPQPNRQFDSVARQVTGREVTSCASDVLETEKYGSVLYASDGPRTYSHNWTSRPRLGKKLIHSP